MSGFGPVLKMPPLHFKVLVIVYISVLVQGYYESESEFVEESSATGSMDLTVNVTTKTKTTANKKTTQKGTDNADKERVINMDIDSEEPCKNRSDSVFVQLLTKQGPAANKTVFGATKNDTESGSQMTLKDFRELARGRF